MEIVIVMSVSKARILCIPMLPSPFLLVTVNPDSEAFLELFSDKVELIAEGKIEFRSSIATIGSNLPAI